MPALDTPTTYSVATHADGSRPSWNDTWSQVADAVLAARDGLVPVAGGLPDPLQGGYVALLTARERDALVAAWNAAGIGPGGVRYPGALAAKPYAAASDPDALLSAEESAFVWADTALAAMALDNAGVAPTPFRVEWIPPGPGRPTPLPQRPGDIPPLPIPDPVRDVVLQPWKPITRGARIVVLLLMAALIVWAARRRR